MRVIITRRRGLWVAWAALLLAATVLATWAGRAGAIDQLRDRGAQERLAEQRDLARAGAEEFLIRMGTYGPELLATDGTMPDYRSRVTEVITPRFADSFEQQVIVVEQLVAQAEQSRTTTVFGTGVAEIDQDAATVLVAGAFTDAYAGSAAQAPSGFRLEVSLVSVDQQWLVDGFAPITAGQERP